MTSPSVVCIMLTTPERARMAERAINAWRAQTYQNSRLFILLTSESKALQTLSFDEGRGAVVSVRNTHCSTGAKFTIGELRNAANSYPFKGLGWPPADIFAHWDDDDYSAPERLQEQVDLLIASDGVHCVGYNDALFLDTREFGLKGSDRFSVNQAWRFRSRDPRYVLGSSMCYWSSAWWCDNFDNVATGEDMRWWLRHAGYCLGVSAVENGLRMVCSIHGGNTSGSYAVDVMSAAAQWQRTDEFDEAIKQRMKL